MKAKISMGLKTKKKSMKKRIFLTLTKRGGFLFYSTAAESRGLSDSLAAQQESKSNNNNKATQCQLKELKHHNRVMAGHRVYFAKRILDYYILMRNTIYVYAVRACACACVRMYVRGQGERSAHRH